MLVQGLDVDSHRAGGRGAVCDDSAHCRQGPEHSAGESLFRQRHVVGLSNALGAIGFMALGSIAGMSSRKH